MDVSVLATPDRQPACWETPEVFSASALDYDPRDDDYAHLDILGHTILAAAKAKAEEEAVDVCFGCPLMMACEKMDTEVHTDPRIPFTLGVIGGRTEAERRARRSGRPAPKTIGTPNPQIAPGDRGPRNQVDDMLVMQMTKAGKTSDQIARDLQCSVRTVTRARRRVSGLLTGPRTSTHPTTPAAPVLSKATNTAISSTLTKPVKKVTPAPAPTRRIATAAPANTETGAHTFLNGRPVSTQMEAVYNYLATHQGTATMETLKSIAAAHVETDEAIAFWMTRNSTVIDGTRVVRASRAATSRADRIREGALAKAHNAIDAAIRKGRYLSKRDATVTFLPAAMTAWQERMNMYAAA